MSTVNKTSEPTATPGEVQVTPKLSASQWHTAEERTDALRAKKQRRRAAHRIALGRSHAKG